MARRHDKINGGGIHPAAWRHPDTNTGDQSQIERQIYMAQRAEAACIDFMFLADILAYHRLPPDVLCLTEMNIHNLEPITLLSALAIAGDDFFTGLFETALEPGELVTGVEFPVPKRAAYMKFPTPASRYAVVGVLVAETASGIRVAVTGAGPCVFRMTGMELMRLDQIMEAFKVHFRVLCMDYTLIMKSFPLFSDIVSAELGLPTVVRTLPTENRAGSDAINRLSSRIPEHLLGGQARARLLSIYQYPELSEDRQSFLSKYVHAHYSMTYAEAIYG